jgi:phospholipase C
MRSSSLVLPALLVGLSILGCGSGGSPTGSGGSGGSGGHGATGGGGSGGAPLPGPPSWNREVTPPSDAEAEANRASCVYKAGSLPAETQGKSRPSGADIPVDHIVILMQENRSFDHYFMKLPENGQPDVAVAPPSFTNPDSVGTPIAPFHDDRHCFVDTNHEWGGSHVQYNDGQMDGFVITNDGWGSPPPHPFSDSTSGVRAMAYYDATDLPFYYFLANEFSIADHYFCSLLGPTWPNRMYLYAGSSRGLTTNGLAEFLERKGACEGDADCGGAAGSCVGGGCKGTCQVDEDCGLDAPVGTCKVDEGGVCLSISRTLFDYMEQRKLDWKVYASGTPGFGLMVDAWFRYRNEHQKTIEEFYADAAAGTLPAVAFVDPHLAENKFSTDDEHPPAMAQPGQAFVAKIVEAMTKSPNWSRSVTFLTYDEHGGLFDHMPPPEACHPGDLPAEVEPGEPAHDFDRYGIRVPMIAISPYAKKHFVSHRVYDHTSILRFVQARFVMPAISNRDANAEAPWEMFDFDAPPHATPPAITIPTVDQAAFDACNAVWTP